MTNAATGLEGHILALNIGHILNEIIGVRHILIAVVANDQQQIPIRVAGAHQNLGLFCLSQIGVPSQLLLGHPSVSINAIRAAPDAFLVLGHALGGPLVHPSRYQSVIFTLAGRSVSINILSQLVQSSLFCIAEHELAVLDVLAQGLITIIFVIHRSAQHVLLLISSALFSRQNLGAGKARQLGSSSFVHPVCFVNINEGALGYQQHVALL